MALDDTSEKERILSMIQIDMQMPTNCLDCIACNEYLMCAIPVNGREWGENDVHDFSQGRPEWCPLKEHEAEKPIAKEDDTFECCTCGAIVGWDELDASGIVKTRLNYCPFCGRSVKWE